MSKMFQIEKKNGMSDCAVDPEWSGTLRKSLAPGSADKRPVH